MKSTAPLFRKMLFDIIQMKVDLEKLKTANEEQDEELKKQEEKLRRLSQ